MQPPSVRVNTPKCHKTRDSYHPVSQCCRVTAALVWLSFTDSQVLFLITAGSGLMTAEFTRELLFLQVNHSHMPTGMRFFGRDLVTVETEPLVAGELL